MWPKEEKHHNIFAPDKCEIFACFQCGRSDFFCGGGRGCEVFVCRADLLWKAACCMPGSAAYHKQILQMDSVANINIPTFDCYIN